MKSVFLRSIFFVFTVQLAACAVTPSAGLRPPPQLGNDVVDCTKQYPASPSTQLDEKPSGDPDFEGWVVFAFELNGDGKAKNIRVVDSEPKGEFVEVAAGGLSRQLFAIGAKSDNCVGVEIIKLYRRRI